MKSLPWITALAFLVAAVPARADGDAAAGEKAFRQCRSCHAMEPAKHRVGPSLHAVFGRRAGSSEGYAAYSEGLKASGIVWDEATLDTYLANPKAVVPDSRMAFAGIAAPDQRADIIAYLKQAK